MADADNDPNGVDAEPLFSTLLAESPQLWRVVDEFVRTLPDQVAAMQDALHDHALDRLQALAAQLKNAGADCGYDVVADRAGAIEQAAHGQVLDELTDKIAGLTSLVAKIQAGLKRPSD